MPSLTTLLLLLVVVGPAASLSAHSGGGGSSSSSSALRRVRPGGRRRRWAASVLPPHGAAATSAAATTTAASRAGDDSAPLRGATVGSDAADEHLSDLSLPYPNAIVPPAGDGGAGEGATGDEALVAPPWARVAASYLRRYGACALTSSSPSAEADSVVPAKVCDAASTSATSRLDELHRRIEARGVDSSGVEDGEYRFLEVVCRDSGGNRFDMPVGWHGADGAGGGDNTVEQPGMPLDANAADALGRLHGSLDRAVGPVVEALFWEEDDGHSHEVAAAGFLINRPGSEDQVWHRDGPDAGFVDAFVPLVDLTVDVGPTEIRMRTHLDYEREDDDADGSDGGGSSNDGDEATIASLGLPAQWENPSSAVAPLLRKGDVLLFDYRTMHRGLGNRSPSTERTLAYVVYRRRDRAGSSSSSSSSSEENEERRGSSGDVHNFPAATTLEYD